MKSKILYLMLLLQGVASTSYSTAGNAQTKTKEKTLSERLIENSYESNKWLKEYFTNYPLLINARPIKDLKHNQKEPIGLPIYLALIYNNNEMVNWLLDNGANLNSNVFLTLFLQKALTSDNAGFTKHFKTIATKNPLILQQKMSFNGEKLTPLEYATNIENNQAADFMATLLKK